ncbi:GDP-mannose 4,6-dehydratase [Helicobacter monodelphidis]|uniref:GDP-mannose 4,6-dehydratase n=1 Tax=Helicobacter sp. 15-1451 TaxID=2004995 RepID=UPI000DCC601F|nr:GDP-mannose 4,6-dehydratase [Helicobacter sp. 15-1451]RAX58882.1 GDP-mannose 4,6-dehydratase [Helicobacter sp. 15-1451]
MLKKAIVTGITGQDGAYLATLLLQKGYEVYGTYRRTSTLNLWRIRELGILGNPHLHLLECDLTDFGNILRVVQEVEPQEIYNLAAQSFVGVSFEQPITTTQITGLGVTHLLEAIRMTNTEIRFYQASTSEMFGIPAYCPQTENTPFCPRSPYGIAKLYAHWMTINYRDSYNIFAVSGILFNHESPLRGLEFVTRKISHNVALISLGLLDRLELGNLDAQRDWGYAKEYVEGMWRMLQADIPETFILSTGCSASVRQFAQLAFSVVGIDLHWEGSGVNEVGVDKDGRILVSVNPKFYRPSEVSYLVGDSSKAAKLLGWDPQCSLEKLCTMMVESDLNRCKTKNFFP